MDCSPPGSSVHGILQARILEWVAIPFSSCLQSFPASRSFQNKSQSFASGGQSIGVSASASVLPTNIQDWFPLGWTGLICLQSKGLTRVFSNTTAQKHQFFSTSLVAQKVKNMPAMLETQVWSLGWEAPLEKGMATHSSIHAWRIPWTEEPDGYSPWSHKELDTTEPLTVELAPILCWILVCWSPSWICLKLPLT